MLPTTKPRLLPLPERSGYLRPTAPTNLPSSQRIDSQSKQ